MTCTAPGSTNAISVAASTLGSVTTPACISRAPPPRFTTSSSGMEIHAMETQLIETRGSAQARKNRENSSAEST